MNRRTLWCCISLLCCCYLDDECDEDMLCALLETDDNRLDEGSKYDLIVTDCNCNILPYACIIYYKL